MKLFKFFNDKSDRPSDTVNGPEIERNGVVIVDDSRFSRNVLRDILENEGFEVVGEAGDGQEAIDKAKELSPEIIFLDVEMPVMDGLGALGKIMKYDPGINVIMCTALGQKKIIMEATRAGAKDYVIKPYRKESITDVLIPYKEAKAEAKAKAKAEAEAKAEAKAKAETEAFFEVEGYVDTEESVVEDVDDTTVELESTDSDEMKLLDYSSEEETLDQVDLGETLDSVYELDIDSLEGTEDSEISDTTEEEMLPLINEFEELASEESDYEAPLILDEIEDIEEIEEVLEEVEDVEETEEDLEDLEEVLEVEEDVIEEEIEDMKTPEEVEDLWAGVFDKPEVEEEDIEEIEEVLEEVEDVEETEEDLEDLEEVLEVEEDVIEEEIEDMKTPEEVEDLWAGVFDKPEVEEMEETKAEEETEAEIEVSAIADDSTNYSFVYLNRFDTQLEGTIRKAAPSSKRISIDFEPSKTEGLSELLGKSDSKRLVMLGMMRAHMLQSDERTNTNIETPSIKLSIKSNENRRYVQDIFGHDVHVEELSMQDILSKVNFTDVSSIKLDDKSGLGLHCAITDLVTKYNQRELFIN